MDTKGATQEQYDVEFSTMADVEEKMLLVRTIVRNKREEYKRDMDRAYQDKMEENSCIERSQEIKKCTNSSYSINSCLQHKWRNLCSSC